RIRVSDAGAGEQPVRRARDGAEGELPRRGSGVPPMPWALASPAEGRRGRVPRHPPLRHPTGPRYWCANPLRRWLADVLDENGREIELLVGRAAAHLGGHLEPVPDRRRR